MDTNDLPVIIKLIPELSAHTYRDDVGNLTIELHDERALRALLLEVTSLANSVGICTCCSDGSAR